MMKNITIAICLSLLSLSNLNAQTEKSINQFNLEMTEKMLEKYGSEFASLEHKNMGDLVQLHLAFRNSDNGLIKLTLSNGIKVTYGEIVMYAGDMFGNPSKSISSCAVQNRMECFRAQFEAMAIEGNVKDGRCLNPINQAKSIKLYMKQVEKELDESRKEGLADWVYYDQNDLELSKKMNTLTCGGSFISSFIPYGNYIKLAQVNFDHFAPDSLVAYKVGHRYALETAVKGFDKAKNGHVDEANKLLEMAYAQNAFANHYLSDSFSAGHMRVPRRAIDRGVHLPAALNLLIANLMHNEDNKNGLNVVNAEGTSWVAYGDGYLYKPEAQLHQSILLNAMQRSADGIYTAFLTGIIPDTYPEMSLLPDYSKIEQLDQTSPLFKVVDGIVLKRVKNDDIHDYHWTKYWTGIATLIQFKVGS